MKQVVLASSSPRRRQLLEQVGVCFTVVEPHYEEDMTLDMAFPRLAETLALGKALSVRNDVAGNSVVIGADTFIELNGRLLGKPRDAAEAEAMLLKLNGKMNVVHTGYAVIDVESRKNVVGCISSSVHMHEYNEDDIAHYVATGEPLDKAGAYAINGIGAVFIRRIEGDYSAVVGLPVGDVTTALRTFGVDVLAPSGE